MVSAMSKTSNSVNGNPYGSGQTIDSISVASNAPSIEPEFAGHKEIKLLFGLSRTHLFRLAKEGVIRSVNLRDRGKLKGRRLYQVASVRGLLLRSIETPVQNMEEVQ
jgi:hypothetical protein